MSRQLSKYDPGSVAHHGGFLALWTSVVKTEQLLNAVALSKDGKAYVPDEAWFEANKLVEWEVLVKVNPTTIEGDVNFPQVLAGSTFMECGSEFLYDTRSGEVYLNFNGHLFAWSWQALFPADVDRLAPYLEVLDNHDRSDCPSPWHWYADPTAYSSAHYVKVRITDRSGVAFDAGGNLAYVLAWINTYHPTAVEFHGLFRTREDARYGVEVQW